MVEQECAYAELDGRDLDPGTRHLGWPRASSRWATCGCSTRATGCGSGGCSSRRPRRGTGLADVLMRAALALVGERASYLHAQTPLADWYAGYGYVRDGEDYLDDGILHTPMLRAF